jgi:hypothetical protein
MKNQFKLFAAAFGFLFGGCASQIGYGFKMEKSSTVAEPPATMAISDTLADFQFKVEEEYYKGTEGFEQYDQYKGITFVIQNKTDSVLTVDWNKISFKDYRGSSGNAVMHTNMKYNDCSTSKPASVVPPKGKLEDIIIPCYGVEFISGTYPRWNLSFLPSPRATPKTEFGVYMPLQFGTLSKNYEFNFSGQAIEKTP